MIERPYFVNISRLSLVPLQTNSMPYARQRADRPNLMRRCRSANAAQPVEALSHIPNRRFLNGYNHCFSLIFVVRLRFGNQLAMLRVASSRRFPTCLWQLGRRVDQLVILLLAACPLHNVRANTQLSVALLFRVGSLQLAD